jgi:hypothetical protein
VFSFSDLQFLELRSNFLVHRLVELPNPIAAMHDRRGGYHMSTHVMIDDSDFALLSTESRSRDVDRAGDRDVLRVDRCVDEANEEGHVFYLSSQ